MIADHLWLGVNSNLLKAFNAKKTEDFVISYYMTHITCVFLSVFFDIIFCVFFLCVFVITSYKLSNFNHFENGNNKFFKVIRVIINFFSENLMISVNIDIKRIIYDSFYFSDISV